MRSWLGLAVIVWSASAAAEPAFSAAPLAGAIAGAASTVEPDPPPPDIGTIRPVRRDVLEKIVKSDLKLDRFTGVGTTSVIVDPGSGAGGKVGPGREIGPIPVRYPDPPPDGLSAKEINDVIVARKAEIRGCYEKGLVKNKDLSGKIVVSFRVAPTGAVATATIKSTTMRSPPVEACVLAEIKKLQFPAKATALVTYPFIFSRG